MQFISKILAIGVMAIAIPLLTLATVLSPVLWFCWSFSFFGPPVWAATTALLFFSPIWFLVLFYRIRRFVITECKLIREVGPQEALWFVGSYQNGSFFKDAVVFTRESTEGAHTPVGFLPEAWADISRMYSSVILFAERFVYDDSSLLVAAAMSFAMWWRIVATNALRVVAIFVYGFCAVVAVIAMSPASFSRDVMWAGLRLIYLLTPGGWLHLRVRLEWLRLAVIATLVDLALLASATSPSLSRHYSARLAGRKNLVSAHFKQTIMKSVSYISNVRLPAFVRNRFTSSVSAADLAKGRQILLELGWPVNVNIVDKPVDSTPLDAHPEWQEWYVASTDFATGIRGLKTHIAEGLKELSVIAQPFVRTEEYKNVINELESTSRYFQDRKVDFSTDVADDVWHIVKPIFANSRLTKFGDIIYLWEKKYALGFWMTTPDGRRKLSRKSFIAKVGMPKFKELWARTFVRASEFVPVAHVSVKDEALSPAKYIADKVRSIIGSPLSHYIGSTVFASWANHNFRYEDTPIKIGMPLNGHHMGALFERHSRMNVHMEGDFTAFDSTLEGPIKRMIREVRKRGFKSHQDHKAICDLIDVMYDQVDKQFLGFTSTGMVFNKGSGLSTGHSSTSMDNSVATITFYLAAWKELTGLSAREFLHFNELSIYGDDHLLSVSAFAPRSWTDGNIMKTMAKWGVVNNLETKKLVDCSFLSKKTARPDAAQRKELAAAGLSHVQRVVWHNKEKLVGKLTAKLKSSEYTYQCTRLMSYLTLTAHHPDIYQAIAKQLASPAFQKILKGEKKKVPTYDEVLQQWYSKRSSREPVPEVDDEQLWIEDGKIVVIGTPGLLDHVLQVLSLVPDLLNPVVFNYGPSRLIQSTLSSHLSWVADLLVSSNGVGALANLSFYAKRTPYAWLDENVVLLSAQPDNTTTLLLRHWCFMVYYAWRPSFKPAKLFDFVIRKFAVIGFAINAKVQVDLAQDVFPFDMVLVAAMLGWVSAPRDPLKFVQAISLPDVPLYMDLCWNRLLTFVWTSVPANFNEVDPVLSKMAHGDKPALIVAGTGTGKSTSLVAHIHLQQVIPHRKLIMIEPRTLLAIGLNSYLQSSFGLNCSAATSGAVFDPNAKVWIMTPQSFLGHLAYLKKDDLIFIDEAHLEEPLVQMLLELVPSWGFKCVAATATPTDSLLAKTGLSVEIPIATIFSVSSSESHIDSVGDYLKHAVDFVNRTPRSVKTLVVLDTPEQVNRAVSMSNYPAQGLSSQHSAVVEDVPRYFSTSVVDVGVTIPGLDVMVSPNWEYGGGGDRYRLSPQTLKQRMGRVGRTNNGAFRLVTPASGTFPPRPSGTRDDAWKAAMAAGISPALGWKLDPSSMQSIFGLNQLTETEVKDFSRVSHIFLTNFRSMKAIELEQESMPSPTGAPAVLVPTGVLGHFSGSVPQDLKEAHVQAMELTGKLLRVIQRGDNVYGLLREKLATIRTGPLYRVANVLAGLANDPSGWRPELKGSAMDADEPDFDEEVEKISQLIDSLRET